MPRYGRAASKTVKSAMSRRKRGTLKSGKGGKVYQRRYGFCLETQAFPGFTQQAELPSVVLKPGERYQSTTICRFSTI